MALTHGGGKPYVGGVNDYATPKGPRGQDHNSVGLGGDNYGISNQPVCHDREVGSPGLGGSNHGVSPTQGRH